MVLICIEYKVCSINYFMDIMQPYELAPILKNLNKSVRNNWEQTRLIMLSSMQPYCKKHLKPSDVIKLPWDKEEKEKIHHVMSTEEAKARFEQANAMKEELQKQGII